MKLGKIKKHIPNGPYCYEIENITVGEHGSLVNVKYCPFHTCIKMSENLNYFKKEYGDLWEDTMKDIRVEWCRLEKCEIDDSCKSCGLKKDYL